MSEDPDRSPIALAPGTRLREEYRVEEVLGMGSFGITYRATDEHLQTDVAIKEYYPRQIAGRTGESSTVRPHSSEATKDFEYGLQQFMQEGRTVARFDHPNVVDVRSYFEENGTGYLVMDYYEGQTLAECLAENGGRLPEEKAVGFVQDVLDGLRPVHDAGVLHRDIDPQNIYLVKEDSRSPGESDRRAILIDFGAAREAIGQRSQSLDVILKPGYAPFEQYQASGNHGPHSDIYACAATLYKCLTGLKPPEAPERIEEDSLVDVREIREEVSMETSLAVKKGLAVRPQRRPSSAREFAELLGRTRTAEGQTEAPPEDTLRPAQQPEPEGTGVSPSFHEEKPSDSGTEIAGRTTGPEKTDGSEIATTKAGRFEDTGSFPRGLIGLGVGIVGLVAGSLIYSDSSAVQVLAFFGTWIGVCAGLMGLFQQGERLMRPEARAAVSDWILGENFAERSSNWPETFTGLFDAVFTEGHLSWACFWRSSLVSIGLVTLLVFLFIGTNQSFSVLPQLFTYSRALTNVLIPMLALPTAVNVVVDYVSLFETRQVLSWMENTGSPASQAGYLLIDLGLTLILILLPLYFLGLLEALKSPVVTEGGAEVSYMTQFSVPAAYSKIMVLSTLFTSVWTWLYLGAGLLLKALQPLLEGLEWLKYLLDVERRPAEAIGLLLVFLASIGFAISAPFVL